MNRAYSLLTIKSIDEDKREIRGIATTPQPDRLGDIVEPKGAQFKLPLALLWQHDHKSPIGEVSHAKVTNDGIEIRATLARVDEPGTLKDRLDEAWQSIKAGLVRGLSIGFKPRETERINKYDGIRFIKWDWLELSAVTVPANADCSISLIRSIDADARTLSGRERAAAPVARTSAVAGMPINLRSTTAMNMQARIRTFEAQRAATVARMESILATTEADGNRTFDDAESEEFKNLKAGLQSCDAMLVELRDMERLSLPTATAAAGASASQGMAVRAGAIITAGRPTVPKGIPFVRYAMALANGRGSVSDALIFAQRWKDSTPEVLQALRNKADVGTTTDTDWAAPLATPNTLASEFIELLRPMTFLGKLNLNNVPFNVKIIRQTAGSTIAWVGETLPKPVGQLAFDSITMGVTKVAGIVVISDELAKLSTPSAEALVRADMLKQVAQYLDQQFIDPSVTASAGVRPASITNGAPSIPASGTDAAALRCDLATLVGTFVSADMSMAGTALLMSETIASALAFSVNALGVSEFPGLTAAGGNINGVTVITSGNLPGDSSGSIIVLLKQDEIYLADEGGVAIDVSREATLDLSGGATAAYSLWQHNAVGFRAERMINWQKARTTSVAYITDAAYSPCA